MYRPPRRSSPSLFTLVLLGIVAGVVFLIYDGWRSRSSIPLPMTQASPSLTPALALETEPTESPAPQSRVPGEIADSSLLVPAAGIYSPVIEVYLDGSSWDVSRLGMNVGHLQGTAWLDSAPGNIALSAHAEMADGRAGIFARLGDLKIGDLVILREGGMERRYTVMAVTTVAPDDLTPVYPTATERITLITCDDYSFIQDTYLERTVVVAERIG